MVEKNLNRWFKEKWVDVSRKEGRLTSSHVAEAKPRLQAKVILNVALPSKYQVKLQDQRLYVRRSKARGNKTQAQ